MTMHHSAEEEEPFHHNWMRFAPRAEGTLLLGYFGGFLVPDPAKRHDRRGAVPRLIMRMTPSGGVSF
jgi:hypothetical protein